VTDRPIGELAENGRPDVESCVLEALDALQRRPSHDPATGHFVAGNIEAGRDLERSEAFWSAVAETKSQLVSRVRADVGGDSAAETKLGLIDGYAEARLFRQAMGVRLVGLGGPVTGTGQARAL
jgi:hypothetical protein